MCWRVTNTEEATMKEVVSLFDELLIATEADTGKSWPVQLLICLLLAAYCLFMAYLTLGDMQ